MRNYWYIFLIGTLHIYSLQPPRQLDIRSILKKNKCSKKTRSWFDCCKIAWEDYGNCCIDDNGSLICDQNGNPTVCCLAAMLLPFVGSGMGSMVDSLGYTSNSECCGGITAVAVHSLIAYGAKDFATKQKEKRKLKAHFE